MNKSYGFSRSICMLVSSCLALFMSACQNTAPSPEETSFEKVSDLAYSGTGKEEPIVYIEEPEGYRPYLVLTNDYDGKTLVLRKELLPEDRRISEYSAYYEQSEIDRFLNGEFWESLPEHTRDRIEDTAIEILDKSCLNRIEERVTVISRKVFLLSYLELGYDRNGHVGLEGTPLNFFGQYENRRAYVQGTETACSWWLRSADSTYDSCVYAVGPEGEIGSTNAFGKNGIRPAFCIDGSTKIMEEGGHYVLE